MRRSTGNITVPFLLAALLGAASCDSGSSGDASGAPSSAITAVSPASDPINQTFAIPNGGTTVSNELFISGSAAPSSTVSIADGGTVLGTASADSSGAWTFVTGALSDGTHSLVATYSVNGGSGVSSSAMTLTIEPDVTSFATASGSSIDVDGSPYWLDNANKSWSISEPDTHTLRFEVQSGDYSTIDTGDDRNRSEIDGGRTLFSPGTTINVTYEFMLESGTTNSAAWFVMGQFHDYNLTTSPPFGVELTNGDHMAISVDWLTSQTSSISTLYTTNYSGVGNISYGWAYTDPDTIQRGHYYTMNISAKFDTSNGFLHVWRDGVQIVDYSGPFGVGYQVYWKNGVYRAPVAETSAIDYQDLQIKTSP